MNVSARILALAAGAALFSLAGAAHADDGDEVTIETPVEVGIDDGAVIDAGDGIVLDDPVEFTPGGDDGVIKDDAIGLPDGIDNPEIYYTMGAGDLGEGAADDAAEQAADRVVERVGAAAAMSADPE